MITLLDMVCGTKVSHGRGEHTPALTVSIADLAARPRGRPNDLALAKIFRSGTAKK
jgi:hypothetical protein